MRRRVLTGLCVAAALSMAVAASAAVLHVSCYRLASASMEPAFPVGTVVVVSGTVPVNLHQPVSFTADGRVVTHILVGYNPDGSMITRGIANPVNDRWRSPVYPRDIRGRVLFGIGLFAPASWTNGRGIAISLGGVLSLTALLMFMVPVRHGAPQRDTMRQ